MRMLFGPRIRPQISDMEFSESDIQTPNTIVR